MSAGEIDKLKELYEFGPFRVDPEKEILLRAGEAVPLTPKTFQILLVLVRHNQELVTKDDLMSAVWPDTFVEEANLSRNIFMLRKALGESPQDHRYIVTVPGRGYRLAENVRLVPGQDVTIVAANHSKVQVQVKERKPWGWISVAVILLLAVAVGTLRFLPHRPVLAENDTVVLADFVNTTGDPVFDGTLRLGTAIQLEQSPFLSLISDERIRQTLRLMGKSADAPLTATAAREICERTGSAAVLEGSIAPIGNQYVLGLRATSCHTGKVLDQEQAQSAHKEDVLNVLSGMASRFRTRLGESIAAVEKHDTPLAEATTSSLEALKAYSAAWKLHASGGAIASLPLFKRATELDPRFAMAHASLGRIYADLDQSDLAAESMTRAWQLRNPVSEREKFFITVNYEMLVTGNLEKARQTSEAWAQTYPREARPHHMLSGMINKAAGRYEEAAAEASKGIELGPDFAIGYYNLAVNNAYLGRFEDADKAMARGTARGVDLEEFLMLQHDLAFLRGNQAEMSRVAAQARERPGAENWISNKESFVLAYVGHVRQAREMSSRAVAEAQHAGQPERASLWEAGAAVREAFFVSSREARVRADSALRLSRNREVEFGAALALALVGDRTRSETLASDLERRFPEDTLVRFSYLPSVRAGLALSGGDFSKALEILQTAAPYELGVNRTTFFGALYPVYLRGEAYLAAKKGQEASTEFQRILDHRGIIVSDPIGALARLQIARAYVLSGDKVKARTSYADFLALWKDADPDIPVLKEAKAEYANVQ